METVELNTTDKNMKFALVKTITMLEEKIVGYETFARKMVTGVHLKYLHGENAYSRPNTECR